MTTASLEFAEVEVAPALAVQLDLECGPDPASIGAAIGKGFESLMSVVNRHSLPVTNPPRAIYTTCGPAGISFTLALPIAAAPESIEPPIRVDTIQGTKALRFTHHGPYPDLAQTYNRITAFMIEKQ